MRGDELTRHADELGLDAIGAAPATAYEETERDVRERRGRGLFADMKFTMARPEVSCHPETLLPGTRELAAAAPYLECDDALLREHAKWAIRRMLERVA